jgi:hypothetical protein
MDVMYAFAPVEVGAVDVHRGFSRDGPVEYGFQLIEDVVV